MDNQKDNQNTFERNQKIAFVVGGSTAAAAGAVALTTQPAMAQSADPVADMASGVSTLSTIAGAAAPIAIGVTIFAVAALLVKKFLYA